MKKRVDIRLYLGVDIDGKPPNILLFPHFIDIRRQIFLISFRTMKEWIRILLREEVELYLFPFLRTCGFKRKFIIVGRIRQGMIEGRRWKIELVIKFNSLGGLMSQIDIIEVRVVYGHFTNVIT